jgi:glycosidase
MTATWTHTAVFYHIYPLGACGAPQTNDFNAAPAQRLAQVQPWLDHIQSLGCNALYLGPLFESSAHGYDTADYYTVDRRLGTNQTMKDLSADLHGRGMRLVLDGVFNHVGRHFWAFRDVQVNGPASPYCGWFTNLRFEGRSPYGDPFQYEGWNGCYDLVKLNLSHPDVRNHLFGAIEAWARDYDNDGLRLDAADCLDFDFLKALSAFCRGLKPDFWLMGEIIHGDYRRWANPEMLDSVTNYECYKGLYSSHLDANYFELAWSLERQFGPRGLYRGLDLYNFADNHDVNRVASSLSDPSHLYPLYALLFTMPGVPSIYYGSEFGLTGKKQDGNDQPLRLAFDLAALQLNAPQPNLPAAIARLAALRRSTPALQQGDYIQLLVQPQQLVFRRTLEGSSVVVAVNASSEAADISVALAGSANAFLPDLLNIGESYEVKEGRLRVQVPPCWARVLLVK